MSYSVGMSHIPKQSWKRFRIKSCTVLIFLPPPIIDNVWIDVPVAMEHWKYYCSHTGLIIFLFLLVELARDISNITMKVTLTDDIRNNIRIEITIK